MFVGAVVMPKFAFFSPANLHGYRKCKEWTSLWVLGASHFACPESSKKSLLPAHLLAEVRYGSKDKDDKDTPVSSTEVAASKALMLGATVKVKHRRCSRVASESFQIWCEGSVGRSPEEGAQVATLEVLWLRSWRSWKVLQGSWGLAGSNVNWEERVTKRSGCVNCKPSISDTAGHVSLDQIHCRSIFCDEFLPIGYFLYLTVQERRMSDQPVKSTSIIDELDLEVKPFAVRVPGSVKPDRTNLQLFFKTNLTVDMARVGTAVSAGGMGRGKFNSAWMAGKLRTRTLARTHAGSASWAQGYQERATYVIIYLRLKRFLDLNVGRPPGRSDRWAVEATEREKARSIKVELGVS